MPSLTTLQNPNVITSRRMLLMLGAGLALSAPPVKAQEAKPLQVVTSFTILADLVSQIAKDRARVTSLVGPGADAHVYRATPADAKAVKEAGLIIVNGLGFEGFMARLVKSSGTRAPVVTATTGIQALKAEEVGHGHGHRHAHDHGKPDPHAWQSIAAVKIYVANIRDGLTKVDPAGTASYSRNADSYFAELAALKAEIDKLFEPIPKDKRVVITSHDALAYFGREFGFTFEAVQGLSTEAEPSAKDVARIIRLAKEHKARAVFIENMTNPRTAERIAGEANVKIGGTLISDALTDEKGVAPTYIAMMRHNARMLAAALR